MLKRDALKLKKGDKVRYRINHQELTVDELIPEPTEKEPRGKFPLIRMDNGTAYSYGCLKKGK